MRRCLAARRARWPGTHLSAEYSWSRLPPPSSAAALAIAIDALAIGASRQDCRRCRSRRCRGVGRRGARANRMDITRGRAGRHLARPGQRHPGSQVQPGFPAHDVRALYGTRAREPRSPRRTSGERVPGVRRRSSGGRHRGNAGRGRGAQWRCPRRHVHDVAASRSGRRPALLQQRREHRRREPPALSQAPPRPLRRDDSAGAGRRLVHTQDIVDTHREPGVGTVGPAGARGGRTEDRGQHLLRGCIRRGNPRAGRRRDDPRQRHQRRLVRPLARRVPAQPDRRDARARDRPAAACARRTPE